MDACTTVHCTLKCYEVLNAYKTNKRIQFALLSAKCMAVLCELQCGAGLVVRGKKWGSNCDISTTGLQRQQKKSLHILRTLELIYLS
jgi:hypothetical protein